MKLTDFLKSMKDEDQLLGVLDEYTSPLDRPKALHLLRRITFHPTPELLEQIVGKTASEAYEIIVGTGNEALPQPSASMQSWLKTLEEDPWDNLPNDIRGEIESRLKAKYAEFTSWWLEQMRAESLPSMEKLTLFLSSIWCIEFTYDTVGLLPPPLLYRNLETLRKNRLSSYKQIAQDISSDGAMIMYQSLFFSSKGKPNENYMRELMELFTMGIGDLQTGETNYTEGDIREGARALTGWRTVAYLGQQGAPANRPFETFFVKSAHDTESKKVLQYGQIKAITDDENTEDLVKQNEVKGVLDILFTERGLTISRFICDKIIRFFIYSNPGASNLTIISELAQYMSDNNFELRKVYKKLFTSQYFFQNEFTGCQIKTPPEYIIGLEKMFGVNFESISTGYTRSAVFSLEQVLYDPPNVGSWKAYRTWISTTTYPLRIKYAKEIIAVMTDTQLLAFAKKFANFSNIDNLLIALIEYILPKAVTKERSDSFKLLLLNGITEVNWAASINNNDSKVAQGIRAFLNRIILSPDFQLC